MDEMIGRNPSEIWEHIRLQNKIFKHLVQVFNTRASSVEEQLRLNLS